MVSTPHLCPHDLLSREPVNAGQCSLLLVPSSSTYLVAVFNSKSSCSTADLFASSLADLSAGLALTATCSARRCASTWSFYCICPGVPLPMSTAYVRHNKTPRPGSFLPSVEGVSNAGNPSQERKLLRLPVAACQYSDVSVDTSQQTPNLVGHVSEHGQPK